MAKKLPKFTNKNDKFDLTNKDDGTLDSPINAKKGNDKVHGLDGNDVIDGGKGNDKLWGDAGDDTLISKSGNDKLNGGEGNDTAVIKGNFADAVITEDGDKITIEIGGRTIKTTSIENFQFDDQTVLAGDLINDAPTGAATADINGTEDTALVVTLAQLLEGFSDPNTGDTLSVNGLTASDGATVVDNGDGTWTITPAANFNGPVTLNYNVTDGEFTVAATNTATIAAVNDPVTGAPTAVLADGAEDTVYTGNIADLLAGFSDADGDTLTVANLAVDNGTIVDNGDGTFSITTAANFNGTVTISYDVTDGNGSTVAASNTVDFAAVNDAPTGTSTAVLADGVEDTAYVVSAADLLQGFSDVEGDTLSVADLTASDGATVVDNGDGTYTVTPAADDNGPVTLSFNVVDGNGGSVAGTNTVNFAAVNDAPAGTPSAALPNGTEDTVYVVTVAQLLQGMSDADGDTLSVANLVASDGATVVDNGNGTFTITPAVNDNGPVTLSYDVLDGNGGTAAVSNTVTFNATNDAPTGASTATLADGVEDTAYVVSAADLLQGFSDIDGDTLSVAGLTASNGATVVDNGDGTFTITPAADYAGPVTLSFNVEDGNGGSVAGSNTVEFTASKNLTAGTDTITNLTASDDVITGAAGTLQATDQIVDNFTDDNDVLDLTLTAAGAAATITNIETINVNWDAFGTATFDATNVTGANIVLSSSKLGFLGAATVSGAGKNTVTASDGMVGALSVAGITGATIDAEKSSSVTANGTAGTADSVAINAGASVASIAVGATLAIETVVVNAGAATTSISVTDYDTATIDAGLATAITLDDNALTDVATVTIGADATVTNSGSLGKLTLDIADGKTVTLNDIGADLTVTGAGDATVSSADVSGNTITDNVAGSFTLIATGSGTVDFSKADADLFALTNTGVTAAEFVSGDSVRVDATFAAGHDFKMKTNGAGDALNVTFTKSQTQVTTFTSVETVNIVAAATAQAGTDLTLASVVSSGGAVNLSGTNDVQITSLNAKTLDASGLVGDLIVANAAAATDVTITGASGVNNVTFDAATDKGAFIGQGGADVVNFGTAKSGAELTAILGGGDDKVSVTLSSLGSGSLVADGGSGNDTFEIGTGVSTGNVVLQGGDGTDTLSLANGADLTNASLNLNVTGLEAIKVDAAASVNASLLSGQSYTITGIGAAISVVTAVGTASADTINLSSLVVSDSVSTGATFAINGAAGNDTIVGSIVTDAIEGGAGSDVMTGGNGSDVFVFGSVADTRNASFAASNTSAANIDHITDFAGNGAAAGDSIELADVFTLTWTGATTATVTASTVATAADFTALFAGVTGTASTAGAAQVYDVTVSGGALAGRYLIVNDGTAAIDANDLIVNITGVTGALHGSDFDF